MRRRIALGAAIGMLLVLIRLTFRLDTGPEVAASALDVQAEIERRTTRVPTPPRTVADLKRASQERAEVEPVRPPEPEAGTSPDPADTVYDSDILGVARAARSRKDAILDCLRKQEASGSVLPQRVSIRFTLEPDGDESRATASVDAKESNTDIADACLRDLFGAVTFDEIDEPGEFVWPFPTAWLDAP